MTIPKNKGTANAGTATSVHAFRTILMVSIFYLIFATRSSSNPLTSVSSQSAPKNNAAGAISSVYPNTLAIPQGKAQALPSIRVSREEDIDRSIYGGKGDKQHLGGFTNYDGEGVSPSTWRYVMTTLGVKSVLDVGCGKGVSTLYFHLHGAKVLCLEGSHDAVENTLLPDPANQVVEHDFSRGPYWPEDTYDAVWSVEFLEHVGRNYQQNYVTAFRKAALLFVTHSQWGGWHHVEVHNQEWWISRFRLFGFDYDEHLTKKIRDVALQERHHAGENPSDRFASIGPDENPYNAQHIWLNMLVFVNPAVASLPEHAHLLAEPGVSGQNIRWKHARVPLFSPRSNPSFLVFSATMTKICPIGIAPIKRANRRCLSHSIH
jgi:SAM-dependent methyltransferase